MICCLNPNCQNPPHPDSLIFCQSCGTKLVLLRNHYRPMQPLGGGGFSKTYLAEDIDKLNERCVIKQFAPQVQESRSLHKAKELFEQEAMRLQQLGEHPQIPKLLAYSPDGQTLVTGSGDNSIKTWNWKTGELKTTLTGHTNWVSTLAMTPNGQMLVSGSGDNSIKIWQVPR